MSMRRLRKITRVFAIALIAFCGILVLAWALRGVLFETTLREEIEAALESACGGDWELSEIEGSWIFGVEIASIEARDDGRAMLVGKASGLRIAVDPWALLGDRPAEALSSLVIRSLDFTLDPERIPESEPQPDEVFDPADLASVFEHLPAVMPHLQVDGRFALKMTAGIAATTFTLKRAAPDRLQLTLHDTQNWPAQFGPDPAGTTLEISHAAAQSELGIHLAPGPALGWAPLAIQTSPHPKHAWTLESKTGPTAHPHGLRVSADAKAIHLQIDDLTLAGLPAWVQRYWVDAGLQLEGRVERLSAHVGWDLNRPITIDAVSLQGLSAPGILPQPVDELTLSEVQFHDGQLRVREGHLRAAQAQLDLAGVRLDPLRWWDHPQIESLHIEGRDLRPWIEPYFELPAGLAPSLTLDLAGASEPTLNAKLETGHGAIDIAASWSAAADWRTPLATQAKLNLSGDLDVTALAAWLPDDPRAAGLKGRLEFAIEHDGPLDTMAGQGTIKGVGLTAEDLEFERFQFAIKASEEGVEIRTGEVRAPGVELDLSGAVRWNTQRVEALSYRIAIEDLVQLQPRIPGMPDLAGSLNGEGTVEGSWANGLTGLSGDIELEGRELRWGPRIIGALDGRIRTGAERVLHGEFSVISELAQVTTKASLDLGTERFGDVSLEGTVPDLNAWLQGLVAIQGRPLGGAATFQASATGMPIEQPWLGPWTIALDASNIEAGSFETLPQEDGQRSGLSLKIEGSLPQSADPLGFRGRVSAELGPFRYGTTEGQSVDLTLSGGADGIDIEALRLVAADSTLQLRARYQHESGTERLDLTALDLELPVARWMGLPAQSDLKVRLREPTRVELSAERISLAPLAVALGTSDTARAGGHANLAFDWRTAAEEGSASLDMQLDDLALAGVPGTGKMALSISADGSLERPRGRIECTLEDFLPHRDFLANEAGLPASDPLGQLIEELFQSTEAPRPLNLNLAIAQTEADAIEVEVLELAFTAPEEEAGQRPFLSGRGTLPYWVSGTGQNLRPAADFGAPFEMSARVGSTACRWLGERSGKKLGIDGLELQVSIGAELSAQVKVLRPRILLDNEAVSDLALGSELNLKVASNRDGGQFTLGSPAGEVAADARIAADLTWSWPDGLDWRSDLPDRTRWRATRIDGQVECLIPQIQAIASSFGYQGFRRDDQLQVSMWLRGSPPSPETEGSLELRSSPPPPAAADAEPQPVLRLEWAARAKEPVDWLAPGAPSDAWLDAPLDGRLLARVDRLAALRRHVPALTRLRGRLFTTGPDGGEGLALSGTLREPRVNGRFEGEDLLVKFSRSIPTFDQGQFALAFEDDALTIEKFNGRLGYRPLELSGKIRGQNGASIFGSKAPPTIEDLRIRGEEILLTRTDHLRVRSNIDLAINGPMDALAITGRVDLSEVLFTQPIDFTTASTPSADPRFQLFSVEHPTLGNAKLDIVVNANRTIEVRNNIVRARMSIERLALRGTLRVPLPEGAISFPGMRLQLPFSRVSVTNGALRFTRENPFDPEIAVLARSNIRGYELDIRVRGPLSEAELEFASRPALSRQDAYLLLTTGATASGLRAENAQGAVVSRAGGLLTQQLLGGGDDPDQKSLAERLQIDIGREISETGAYTLEVEYEYDDPWYIHAERDRFDAYNLGVIWRIRF